MNGPVLTYLIIAATAGVSWMAFNRPDLRERLLFDPYRILHRQDYYRLLTSGLVHGDWPHLIFNMLSLYFFADGIELRYGPTQLAFIYLSSIVGGGLLSLFIHRNHAYRALGASGGVCGVIFAAIFLIPGQSIMFFLIPIPIPAWAYALIFLAYSFYGMRTQRDNIGHDAHLGGAIIGLLVATALHPSIIKNSPVLYPTVLVIAIAIFIYLLLNSGISPRSFRPGRSAWRSPTPPHSNTGDDDARVNALLDKISRSGVDSLTPEEQEFLRRKARGG